MLEQVENLNETPLSRQMTVESQNRNVEVFYQFERARAGLNPNEKTIVILPGLDDSIFHYTHAIELIRQFNPEWNYLGVDLLGQGKTRDNATMDFRSKIEISDQCEVLDQVIKNLNLKNIFIVGLSYGGAVALYYSAHYCYHVLGLGLIAPYVSRFKGYRPGLSGLYYNLLFLNPFYKKISQYSLPHYFLSAKFKGTLNPEVKWTKESLDYLSKLTLGVMDLDTDKTLDQMSHLPLGIHILSACQDIVVPIAAHRHFYNRIPKSMDKSFSLEDSIGHRVLAAHPKRAAKWLHRIL